MKSDKAAGADPSFEIFRLWRLMDHTGFLIARLRERELARFGITPEQAHVLDILSNAHGSSTINRISEITARRHHSISTLILRMIDQGLVTRTTDADDRRKLNIHITEKGQNLFNSITRDSIIDVFSCLDAEHRNQLQASLVELLHSARNVMDEQAGSELPGGPSTSPGNRG